MYYKYSTRKLSEEYKVGKYEANSTRDIIDNE